jgi:mRNA degradation ribonuclease J1/J2
MQNNLLVVEPASDPLAGLTRIANQDHRLIRIQPGDIAALPMPGNERMVNRTINNLFRQGTEVFYQANPLIGARSFEKRW